MNALPSRQNTGRLLFFTVVTCSRQSLLTKPGNIQRLREAFNREQRHYPFVVESIVILPDHLHCIWALPEDDADYSSRWTRIKRYFNSGCRSVIAPVSASRIKKREHAVWQRRFWEHRIRDDEDWRRHMDYIHYNPVKHGFAGSPWVWPYSSLSRCAARGWYSEDWCMNGTPVISDVMAGE